MRLKDLAEAGNRAAAAATPVASLTISVLNAESKQKFPSKCSTQ